MKKKIRRATNIIIRKLGLKGFTESCELSLKLHAGLSPIIIYQMGKVGSSTIYNSIKESQVRNPVFHLHFLSDSGHYSSIKDYQRTRPGKRLYDHIRHSQIIRSQLGKNNVKWKVITLVREPIVRDISDYFQTLERKHPEHLDENNNIKDIDRIFEDIYDILINFDEASDYACTWFDRELQAVFGIDVYAYPFDKDKGYKVIEGESADVLIIRLEDINHCGNILTKFLNASRQIKIINDNMGGNKMYASQYRTVKSQLSLPKHICEKIYASKLSKHFYDDEAIAKFITRWTEEKTSKPRTGSVKL